MIKTSLSAVLLINSSGMKFTDKLYQWFYGNKNKQYSNRIFTNILRGGSVSFTVWILSLLFDRFIGLSGTFYWYLPHFITGGFITGAIIGMVSTEVLWHKHRGDSKQ